MLENFDLEIISPDKTIVKTETNEVILPSFEGLLGVLKDHIPLVTFLRPGLIEVKKGNEGRIFFVEDGIVEFSNNKLLILTATALEKKNLSEENINKMIEDAENKIKNNEIKDKEKYILSHKIDTLKELRS